MHDRDVPEPGAKSGVQKADRKTGAAAGAPRKKMRRKAKPADDDGLDTISLGTADAPALARQEGTRTVSSAVGPRSVPQRPGSGARKSSGQPATVESKKVRPVLKLLNGLLTFVVVMLLAVGGAAYYLQAAVDASGPLKESKLLIVPKNDGIQQIADRLENEGMVGDRRMFLAGFYTLKLMTLAPGLAAINLKAGEYEIKPGASIRSLVDTMSLGRSVLMRVTVPEGLTSYQIVERLKADTSLTGDVRDVPAEGTLLPETYSLPRGSSRQTLLEMMQAAQKKLVEQLWAERQEGLPLKTPADAIILASIIEKETGRNDERERVASVFVNRLRKNMRLQSDPTILYGLALGKVQWGKTIYQSDIASKTAHNTYAIPALPPTPICNPGRLVLEATLKPASGNDIFFVADGRGGHVFAETLAQHNANVAKWRQTERERAAGAAAATAAAPAPATATAAPAAVTTINSPTSKAGTSSLAPGAQKK
jgi:UPF0755 protein